MKKLFAYLLVLHMCNATSAQIYFDTKTKLGKAIDETGNALVAPCTLTAVDYPVIEKLFEQLKNDGWIEFKYPQNGCQYRAHAMARMLLENGIESNKIWSFKPKLLGDSRNDELVIPDPNFPGDKIKWVYHVAPVVVAKMGNNKTDTLAIDPSMFKKPVPYRVWLDSLNCKAQYYTFVHSKYIQYETSVDVLNGKWYRDNFSIDKRWVTTSICQGKIFYLFIANEILPIAKRIKELDALIAATTTTKQKDGLEMEKKYLWRIYDERKNIGTNSAKFTELPREYQAMLIDCQERLMDCYTLWWDSMVKGQAADWCK